MRQLLALLIVAAAIVAAGVVASPASAATTKCPSGDTPAPGSTITGGQEVDGFQCKLVHVTVYGGITVDAKGAGVLPIGYVALGGSTVNGGIVDNGGGVDIGVGDFFAFDRTGEGSTINGGVKLNHPLFFSSADATIRGGFTVNGQRDPAPVFGCTPGEPCFEDSFLCGNTIVGNVTVQDEAYGQVFMADPGEVFYGNWAACDANTIHGSVFLTNSNFINPFSGEANEIEGDAVSGSVNVDHSTAEVYGNTIAGSLLCTNGTVIQPPAAGDPSGSTNTVGGTNTCL